MRTFSGRKKFRSFRFLLDRGSTSIIKINNIISKLKRKKSTTAGWKDQSRKFRTTGMEKVDFCVPGFTAMILLYGNVMYTTTLKSGMI